MEKNIEKNIINIDNTEPLYCTAEIITTLQINCTLVLRKVHEGVKIKKCKKERQFFKIVASFMSIF